MELAYCPCLAKTSCRWTFLAQGISSNAKDTMPLLLADAAAGLIDVIVHIGDAAYDLDSNSGATGDAFMVQIEPLSGESHTYHATASTHCGEYAARLPQRTCLI